MAHTTGWASCHTGNFFSPRLTEEEDAKLHGAQHGQEALAQHEGEELQAEGGGGTRGSVGQQGQVMIQPKHGGHDPAQSTPLPVIASNRL